jgi:hypothetical protein
MWKEQGINYRHVLEIKKFIESAMGGSSLPKFLSSYIANIEDF